MIDFQYRKNGEPNEEIAAKITCSAQPAIDDRIEKGRAAWKWLHQQCETDSLTPEREVNEFRSMIPAYGCACLSDWTAIIAENPIPETGQALWAIKLHNIVNEKIGKPQWIGIID